MRAFPLLTPCSKSIAMFSTQVSSSKLIEQFFEGPLPWVFYLWGVDYL